MKPPNIRDGTVCREELGELGNAAVVMEDFLNRPVGARQPALVTQFDPQARHQEGGLSRTRLQFLIGEPGVGGEDLAVGPVADPCSRHSALSGADNLQAGAFQEGGELGGGRNGARIFEVAGLPPAEGHLVGLAPTVHLYVQAG